MSFKSAIGLTSCPAFLLRMKTEFRGLKGEPSGMNSGCKMCEQFVLHLNVVSVKKNPMSSQLPAPAASNTFERIKRVNAEGHELWSMRAI
jgi:hypothetical protein